MQLILSMSDVTAVLKQHYNLNDNLAIIWREISKIQYGDTECRVPLALLGSACLLEKLKRNDLI